ncbi:MAG TPA: DUF4936 family protein [Noviherbaspirillum sp.]|nr:DUF4936 family protein [Noviherbaspirillum sp.]
MDLYIYYRARCEDAHALCTQVRGMQQCLSREYGIVTRLKRRPEIKDGQHTWMEIYQDVPDSFAEALERAVVQAGLPALIDGQRNIEYFLDVSSCA